MNRRNFLRNSLSAALGGVSIYSALGNMKLVAAAAAQQNTFTDYKALVCLFMTGGNDSFNTVVPISGPARAIYQASRQTLAIPASEVLPLTSVDGSSYGLYGATSSLDPVGTSGVRDLFNTGKAAVVCNVGTLVRPTTPEDITTPGFPLPGEIGAHNGQQNWWQTSRPDNVSGWGGRMADLLYTGNANRELPMTIAIDAEQVLLQGSIVMPYSMNGDPYGAEDLELINPAYANRREAFLRLMDEGTQRTHMLERSYARMMNRTIANYQGIAGALDAAPPLTTPFPTTLLGSALKMVARTISVRTALGMGRQIFFVELGGFDTHDNQLAAHPVALASVAQSLAAFYNATVELGVADGVTAFTASDFGRNTASNGDGSDHGWGGHHFVIGGSVNGGSFYGTMPNLTVGGPDDGYYGAVIPKISVDQYGATLARWFGVAPGNLNDVFPNLGNFQVADLGFMR